MKKFLLGVLVGGVLACMAGVIFFFATIRFAGKPPDLPQSAILLYTPSGDIPEISPVELPFAGIAGQTSISMLDTWRLLRSAAADDRIRAVLVVPRGLTCGWGKIDEIREGLEVIRKAGKPVYARLEAPGMREYYLATAASKVFLSPEDWLDVKGLRIEAQYFRKTLAKLGVEVEVEHIGKYKDAADTFARDSMTPETRQVLDSILDDTYSRLVNGIAKARGKRHDEVRAMIDDGPFLAAAAKDKGLIDGLLYSDQVEELLKQDAKSASLARIGHRDYLRATEDSSDVGRRRPKIAVLAAQGDIIRGSLDGMFASDQVITPGAMTRQLRALAADSTIRGVILRVDSPGGDGIASDEILREVRELRKKKPVVVSMSDLAASGGYYIAMSGDPIVAYPGTYTGSIGVIFGKVNLAGLYDKLGIKTEILKRGRFADIDTGSHALTPEGRRKLRESLEVFYDGFVQRVAEGRKMDKAAVNELAQGRVWLGSQAKANHLVDELGGIDRAIDLLKTKAGIDRDTRVRVLAYPVKRSFWQEFLGRRTDSSESLAKDVRGRVGPGIVPWLEGGVLRVMPYRLQIR